MMNWNCQNGPHNNRVDPIARGQHARCVRNGPAGSLRPCPSGPAGSGRAHGSLERYTDETKLEEKKIFTRLSVARRFWQGLHSYKADYYILSSMLIWLN
jgi:hypothetical protein